MFQLPQVIMRRFLGVVLVFAISLPLLAAPGNAPADTVSGKPATVPVGQGSPDSSPKPESGTDAGTEENQPSRGGSNGADAGNANNGNAGNSANNRRSGLETQLPETLRAQYSELQNWLETDTAASRLRGIAADILPLVAQSAAAGIPPALFQIRLREAAAKNVSAGRVQASLEADAGYWKSLAEINMPENWLPAEKRISFYLAAASALRNGMSEDQIKSAIQWAAEGGAAPERVAAAAVALSAMQSFQPAEAALNQRVLRLLSASRLRTDRYVEVVGLLQQAVRRGWTLERALAVAESVLDGDSSISRLRSALAED